MCWRHQDPAVIQGLTTYPKRRFLLMIDFDDQAAARLQDYANLRLALPDAAQSRVYLLGSLKTPELLRKGCGRQLEDIGKQLASDCPQLPAGSPWSHQHMQHNAPELVRLVAQVQPFLFLV